MKHLLFLSHRIPYPPTKGDKIRSFHLLKFLSQTYRIHLGAFVDDPDDWRSAGELARYCEKTHLLPLPRAWASLRSLKGLLTGEPLTLPYYRDARMAAWVRECVVTLDLHAILVFSSAMAQYVERVSGVPRLIDFVDVDADKWRQYAERRSGPMAWVYRREAARLLTHDRRVAARFDRSLFVSAAEAELFGRLAPETVNRLMPLDNGVDTTYFDPAGEFPNPYPGDAKVLVFTGAMDYRANVDAALWFAEQVFPAVREAVTVRFYVVGARPTEAVRALARRPGISVTGAVDDIRPYLRHAHCAVAPLRIARGIQNKVLEAMAMALPVLATPAAMEGIETAGALDLEVLETPEEWIGAARGQLQRPRTASQSLQNRRFVEHRYGWERSLRQLADVLESL